MDIVSRTKAVIEKESEMHAVESEYQLYHALGLVHMQTIYRMVEILKKSPTFRKDKEFVDEMVDEQRRLCNLAKHDYHLTYGSIAALFGIKRAEVYEMTGDFE